MSTSYGKPLSESSPSDRGHQLEGVVTDASHDLFRPLVFLDLDDLIGGYINVKLILLAILSNDLHLAESLASFFIDFHFFNQACMRSQGGSDAGNRLVGSQA
jgi:hypothetical protein